ncbi:hypothetical protein PCL_03111 [Purpureocillium lilacinum]|uniref:Uncharacterized protein n=1 Tax=Purpureocillium lilacinum TaxID=33203 RepID=A0A2U3DYM1_PURLI|nr:hypothetical protein Purlil1_551 [Purpureocillium lilacinum]PWI67343.1 hypothetical protein PCL_03111 [Purpureocillium lilacinum]
MASSAPATLQLAHAENGQPRHASPSHQGCICSPDNSSRVFSPHDQRQAARNVQSTSRNRTCMRDADCDPDAVLSARAAWGLKRSCNRRIRALCDPPGGEGVGTASARRRGLLRHPHDTASAFGTSVIN